jgi:hypothetical protein
VGAEQAKAVAATEKSAQAAAVVAVEEHKKTVALEVAVAVAQKDEAVARQHVGHFSPVTSERGAQQRTPDAGPDAPAGAYLKFSGDRSAGNSAPINSTTLKDKPNIANKRARRKPSI